MEHPTSHSEQMTSPTGTRPIAPNVFPTDPTGLPEATEPRLLDLGDGDSVELSVAPVAKQLGDATVRMLAFGDSVPGPTLKVRQGTELLVHVSNHGDLEATVHWHGLRLENRYDGVPVDTQPPIPVGGDYTYRLQFPDPGLYWYHPHIREDYTQELGLYGNILVTPTEPDYWPPVDAEMVLPVDDLLLEAGRVAPFARIETTYAAMGRYGNVFLVNGLVAPRLAARAGEVVRLWLTNTANTRVFNLAVPGARMKLVGGDSGRVERAGWLDAALIAPSERIVLDVMFDTPGDHPLEHRTPRRTYTLATFDVQAPPADPTPAAMAFDQLGTAPELLAERERLLVETPPDKVLALLVTIDDPTAAHTGDDVVVYRCPMHPAVTASEPGRCPQCGMKLLAAASDAVPPADHAAHHEHSVPQQRGDALAGIEWEDDMVEMNRDLTSTNTHWRVVDRTTGVDRDEIDWVFAVGDRVKIRVVNETDSDHPMQHPFHIHGAGRFLVIARDGAVEPNLVWKDTVLIRTGETVDLLLDVTNPGRWMAHCHIAEHLQSGMMFAFTVTGESASG